MTVGKQAPSYINVERAEHPTDQVRELVEELDRELAANYPAHQRHGLALDAIFQPHVRFFVARCNGQAVGCGGIALFAEFAEIKRMFVRPESRGTGVAEAIMEMLSVEASDAGLSLLRLETGTRQSAAIHFYRRCGFQPCPAFEPYSSMRADTIVTSVFLEKQIRVT